GQNVWWSRLSDYAFPRDWKELPVADSRIAFAWGPAAGGKPVHIDAMEIAITAGNGGKGTVWIDEIRLESRDAVAASAPPAVMASSNQSAAPNLLDGDPATFWQSDDGDRAPVVTLDFHEPQEQGGLEIEHAPGGFAASYAVEVSSDGSTWDEVRR